MKKIFFIFLLCILVSLSTYSQTGWIQNLTNTGNTINSVTFTDQYTGFAVGTSGTILKTTNGGTNWVLNTLGTYGYQQVVFPQSDSGLVFGTPGVCYKTTNRGQNWFITFISWSDVYTHAYFFNENTGWVIGYNAEVYKTTNAGYNWDHEIPNSNSNLYSCSFINENTGWIAGSHGIVSKTVDGGNNWLCVPVYVTNDLNGITFIDENTGWLCGANGLIMKSLNGCVSWFYQNSGVTSNLTWISFIDENTGYACGAYGVVLKTVNGGLNWYRQQVQTTESFSKIVFLNSETGWVCGTNGALFKTTNGGESIPIAPYLISPPDNSSGVSLTPTLTWSNTVASVYNVQISSTPDFGVIIDSSATTLAAYTVPAGKLITNHAYYWRVRADYYYGTSDWSLIWKFTTQVVGITPLSSEVPGSYSLYQNFPNPFNPETRIRFDIPKSTNVKLSVYDINGRLIENLFGGTLPAGSFECKWNASKYSSGLYFIRMESKEYSSVRKMTLIK